MTIETTVWNAAIDAAQKYLRPYRLRSLTNSQIVAAMTTDARVSFSEEQSAEVAEAGFKYLERNHYTMIEE